MRIDKVHICCTQVGCDTFSHQVLSVDMICYFRLTGKLCNKGRGSKWL